jgi:flagellar basal body-associated protein FliL
MSAEKPKQEATRPEEKSTNANPNKWIFIAIFAGILGIFLLLVAAGGVVAVVVATAPSREAAREAERVKKAQEEYKRAEDAFIRANQRR